MIAVCRIRNDGSYEELYRFAEVTATSEPVATPSPSDKGGFLVRKFPDAPTILDSPQLLSPSPGFVVEWFERNAANYLTKKIPWLDVKGLPLTSYASQKIKTNTWAHLKHISRNQINDWCKELGINNINAELTIFGYMFFLHKVYGENEL